MNSDRLEPKVCFMRLRVDQENPCMSVGSEIRPGGPRLLGPCWGSTLLPITNLGIVIIKPFQVMRADFARCSLEDGISSWFAPGLPTWARGQWLVVNLCQGSLSLPLFPHANLCPQCWLRLSGGRCLQAVSFLLIPIPIRKLCDHNYHV